MDDIFVIYADIHSGNSAYGHSFLYPFHKYDKIKYSKDEQADSGSGQS